MKIIFSRKGFDSAAGGVASPIFPSGHLVSLPIPEAQSPICYNDIQLSVSDLAPDGRAHLGAVVHDLSRGAIDPAHGVHLDPDLNAASLPRQPGWAPLFGQAGAAQGHLRQQGVGVGDLFLFYGWFRRVHWQAERWRYVPDAPDLHVIFGWMQVGRVLPLAAAGEVPAWAAYHPHCQPAPERPGDNVLYCAATQLHLNGHGLNLPGAGLFRRFRRAQQLTAPDASRSVWRLPSCFLPDDAPPLLSFHTKRTRWTMREGDLLLRTVGRGQEFVFDSQPAPDVFSWLEMLFEL